MSDKNETHVHVLEDGTVLEHTHGEQEHVHTHNGTQPRTDQGCAQQTFQGHRSYGIHQAHGGGRT